MAGANPGPPAARVNGKSAFTAADRRKTAVIFTAAWAAFALAVLIVHGLSPTAQSHYPEPCNTAQNATSCVDGLALSTSNILVCGYLPTQGEVDSCATYFASGKSNPEYCLYISKSDSNYSKCITELSISTKNAALCGTLGEGPALNCLYNVSLESDIPPSGCGSLGNTSYAAYCSNLLYYRDALSGNNPALCSNLAASANYSLMYYMTRNASGTPASVLDVAFNYPSLNMTPASLCYYAIAVNTGNESLCRSATGTSAALCNYTITGSKISAIEFNTSASTAAEACGGYNSTVQPICYYKFDLSQAIVQNSVAPCMQLQGQIPSSNPLPEECILQLALNTSNSAYCASLNATFSYICSAELQH